MGDFAPRKYAVRFQAQAASGFARVLNVFKREAAGTRAPSQSLNSEEPVSPRLLGSGAQTLPGPQPRRPIQPCGNSLPPAAGPAARVSGVGGGAGEWHRRDPRPMISMAGRRLRSGPRIEHRSMSQTPSNMLASSRPACCIYADPSMRVGGTGFVGALAEGRGPSSQRLLSDRCRDPRSPSPRKRHWSPKVLQTSGPWGSDLLKGHLKETRHTLDSMLPCGLWGSIRPPFAGARGAARRPGPGDSGRRCRYRAEEVSALAFECVCGGRRKRADAHTVHADSMHGSY